MNAPFTYFGGKRRIALEVWAALGDPQHYIEPFFGSGAVLLAREDIRHDISETVNDVNGLLCNFWRAAKHDPEAVAAYADIPVNEIDKRAVELYLVQNAPRLLNALTCNSEYYDARAAGYWLAGTCMHIGRGFANGIGAWSVQCGVFARHQGYDGVNAALPGIGHGGAGINRVLSAGVTRNEYVLILLQKLAERLRDTRVACGNWTRVLGPSVLAARGGITGVYLDPPYHNTQRSEVYTYDAVCHAEVEAWCLQHAYRDKTRIVLSGYAGNYSALVPETGWRCISWAAQGGYGNQGSAQGRVNAKRERLWLSPQCLDVGAVGTAVPAPNVV